MIKIFSNEIKLSKLSYLLEVIEVRDNKSKLKAFNKIRKMKLTREMGLLILDNITKDKLYEEDNFNIHLSLLFLLFNDFYLDYAPKIAELYKYLNDDSKYEVLNILSISKNEDSVYFYRDLVSNFYNGEFSLPIGTISTNPNNYNILFPELYNVYKLDIKKNNAILIISDFINMGVVPKDDLNRYKKELQHSINLVFKEGVNFKSDDKILLQNDDYFGLRILLEAAINIEFYVSNKTTKDNLSKLLRKKDNQLKLFILENYIKKGRDISRISFNSIAKDPLSRYPLYSFLMFYNPERLMPKKYCNNKSLAESDLMINYSIKNSYKNIPYDFEYVDNRVINNQRYYIFRFKTSFNYDEEIKDPGTDYILKTTNINKKLIDNSETEYIGISGGYNIELDPSIIEKELPNLIVRKIDDSLDIVVEKIFNELESVTKVNKKIDIVKKKEKIEEVEQEEVVDTTKEVKNENNVIRILRKTFCYNTLLIVSSIILLFLIVILINYVNGNDILNLTNGAFVKKESKALDATTMDNPNFREIHYTDLYKKEEKDYYVLIYKKKNVSVYYTYLNTLLDNSYVIYYIDLSNEANKDFFGPNPTGFIPQDETFVKVADEDYEFYVTGKTNILKELRSYIDEINKKKEEELQKEKEEKSKTEEEVKEKKKKKDS